jgi:hypothetical protein
MYHVAAPFPSKEPKARPFMILYQERQIDEATDTFEQMIGNQLIFRDANTHHASRRASTTPVG